MLTWWMGPRPQNADEGHALPGREESDEDPLSGLERARLSALYTFDFFLLYFGREKHRRRHAAGKLGK